MVVCLTVSDSTSMHSIAQKLHICIKLNGMVKLRPKTSRVDFVDPLTESACAQYI